MTWTGLSFSLNPLPNIVVFISLIFESIFTSDTSSLQHYCYQSPCFTLPFYLGASASRKTLQCSQSIYIITHYSKTEGFRTSGYNCFIARLLFFVCRRTCVSFNVCDCFSNVDASEKVKKLSLNEPKK